MVFTSGLNLGSEAKGSLTNFVSDNGNFLVLANGTEAALGSPFCRIVFMPNGGSGTMDSQNITIDGDFALNANTFTLSNYDFTGWNTKADGSGDSYSDKQTVSLTGVVTLYAQWAAVHQDHDKQDDDTYRYAGDKARRGKFHLYPVLTVFNRKGHEESAPVFKFSLLSVYFGAPSRRIG